MNYLLSHTFRLSGLCLLAMMLSGCPARPGLLSSGSNTGTNQPVSTEEDIFDANIKTVRLYREGTPGTAPVTFIGPFDPLTLDFDELHSPTERESEFFVDLVACDEYWRPARILPIEFYDGSTLDRIQEFQRSEFGKVPYVHYRYQFPQENETFKLSGNYLIKVLRNGDPNEVVLTRRFVVVESLVGFELTGEFSQASRRRRMEELDFFVNPGQLELFDPMNDLRVNLLPNFCWQQAVELSPQNLVQGQLRFDIDLLTSVPNGHEFRQMDIRSTRFLSESVQDVEERDEVFDVYLFSDEPWLTNTFGRQPDFNGQYLIEVQEWPQPNVQADYVYVYFSLPRREKFSNREVYVMGRFTDWHARASNRMQWNEELKRYELSLLLKQGFYNYQYATTTASSPAPENSTFQGRLTDAENLYYVIVYFRGPLDRNDRVVGFWSVNG